MSVQSKAQVPLAKIDRPKNVGNPRPGWGSDAIAQIISKLDLKYVSLVPGASFRGLHDSLVNHLGGERPRMLMCLHEEHAVALAHGYAKVTGEPLSVTFADYLMPTLSETPKLDILLAEDAPSIRNPLGIKGAGESGIAAVGAAIASAIDDAIGIPGAITQLPVTPQRLKRILDKARPPQPALS